MNRLRQILTVFLVGLTFFVMQAFGNGTLQAQATNEVESPVGKYYTGQPGQPDYTGQPNENARFNNDNTIRNDNKLVENARKNLKETADSARESVSRGVNDTAQNLGDTVDNVRQSVSRNVNDTTRNLGNTVDNVRESVSQNVNDNGQNLRDSVRTPEGTYYNATPDRYRGQANNLGRDAKNPLEETAENVREKLNLDEPLPRSTKQFLESTKERVGSTVEPITGDREGYYQEPPVRR